jgi:hypothetical protein
MHRQQMHGGQFYGAGMVGAGATPSMGLSQFRGGASHKCPSCCRKRCVCEESSSDEENMEGGAVFSNLAGMFGDVAAAATRGLRGLRGLRGVRTAARPVATSTELVPFNPVQAAFTTNSRFRNAVLADAFGSRALVPRATGALKPYNAAEAAARIRAAQAAGETTQTVAARLARMGITPARVAAALALGIPAITLAAYFGDVDGVDGGDPGYFQPPEEPPPGNGDPDHGDPPWVFYPPPPTYPEEPPLGPGGIPRGRRGRFATGEGVATGNLADEYFAAQRRGSGKQQRARRSNPRAAIVSKVMRERGLNLPAASRYVKEHGLY